MTFDLVDMRRRFGLTQIQLADVMSVTQSTVSRWERGLEPIRHSKRLELLDLFSNRNGKLDPLVKQLAAQANNLTAFDFDLNCFTTAQFLNSAARLNTSDVVGKNYSQLCESEWFSTIYGDVPLDERVFFEYEHVVAIHGGHGCALPIRTKQYFVQFEDSPGMMLSVISNAPPIEKPRLIQKISTNAFSFS